jgi:hypothetical protein
MTAMVFHSHLQKQLLEVDLLTIPKYLVSKRGSVSLYRKQ